MIFRLALRSLATRPIRTAVLACGFGFGIAIMAALLGVARETCLRANCDPTHSTVSVIQLTGQLLHI